MGILPKKLTQSGPLVQWGTIIASVIGLHYVIKYFSKEEEYVPGPYGERKNLSFDIAPFTGEVLGTNLNGKKNYTVEFYRTCMRATPLYKEATKEEKEYCERAILNYRWGYTFYDGRRSVAHSATNIPAADDLDIAIFQVMQFGTGLIGSNAAPSIVWPLPKKAE